MQVLYLDESGDHSLTKIDPQFPLFALAGCVFKRQYHDEIATPSLSAYKLRLFGTDRIVLHTADISRNKNGFEGLKDTTFRNRFYEETNRLIEEMDFEIIAAVIKKNEHLARYSNPANPYSYSLECILERFFFMLDARSQEGTIVAESRNSLFDRELYDTFRHFMGFGTTYVSGKRLTSRIKDLCFRRKSDNIAGLQVADLVVTPIARHVMGKSAHEDFEIIQKKFRCSPTGNYHGWGLKILP